MTRTKALLSTLLILTAPSALAHTGEGLTGAGLLEGFLHPVTGPDHVAAMVGVGILGAILGRPAVWLLPLAFPLMMAVGGALGIAAVPLPGVEIAIAGSGVVIGALIVIHRKFPLAAALVLVAVFAIFHGYAHGAEAPETANPFAYSIGFVIGTGLMHVCGIAIGYLDQWPKGQWLVRTVGGAIAATGTYFLVA